MPATKLDPESEALLGVLGDPNVRFPARPRLATDLAVFTMPDGLGLQIRGGMVPVAIKGASATEAMRFVLSVADGTLSLDDFLQKRPATLSTESLLRTLWVLHTKGLLVDESPSTARDASTAKLREHLFWERRLSVTRSAKYGTEFAERLGVSRVVVVASGLLGVATCELLVASGVGVVDLVVWKDADLLEFYPQGARVADNIEELKNYLEILALGGDLIVGTTMNAPPKCLHILNDIALTFDIPVLFGNDDGAGIDIGPLVHPYRSACLTCKSLREQSSDEHAIENILYQLDQDKHVEVLNPRGEWIAGAAIGASLLVAEVVRVLTRFAPPTLVNAVLRADTVNGNWNTNQCTRVPRCPDCSRVRPS
jgi:bacteriocin biosynthesis cyclodehydratase domain-containing protein